LRALLKTAHAFPVSLSGHAAATLLVLSGIFGVALVLLTPPLRGMDETAHFLRAYGIGQGDFVPATTDSMGRKGIHLPRSFHRDFSFFDEWQTAARPAQGYREIFGAWWRRAPAIEHAEGEPVFVPYSGSEGYSPVAYLPQATAAFFARVSGLGFLPTFYLMRLAGLVAMSAAIAYALAVAPSLQWPFLAIAMLPSALYARAVINADAAAFAYGLIIVAMFLRDSLPRTWGYSAWMMLCALSKPPNIIFMLLEPLRAAARLHLWRDAAILMLPPIIAGLLWIGLTAGDTAAWRLTELTGAAAREFDPTWKLQFVIVHPLEFPAAMARTIAHMNISEIGRQLIGVLGLFDTVLRTWTYWAIALLVAASFAMPLRGHAPLRKGLAAALVALCYGFAIFLICYVAFTPVGSDQIWGVQGRYFVPALPLLAVIIAALVKRGFEPAQSATFGGMAAVISGFASLEAILRADWGF
jgi:uncharacterized membrane protein